MGFATMTPTPRRALETQMSAQPASYPRFHRRNLSRFWSDYYSLPSPSPPDGKTPGDPRRPVRDLRRSRWSESLIPFSFGSLHRSLNNISICKLAVPFGYAPTRKTLTVYWFFVSPH